MTVMARNLAAGRQAGRHVARAVAESLYLMYKQKTERARANWAWCRLETSRSIPRNTTPSTRPYLLIFFKQFQNFEPSIKPMSQWRPFTCKPPQEHRGKRTPKGVKLKTIPTNRHLIHEFIFYPFGNEVIIKTLKAKSILVYVSNPTLCHSANTPQ